MDSHALLLSFINTMKPNLKKFYGLFWWFHLKRNLLAIRFKMRRTSWAGRRDDEAKFASAFALLPILFLDLKKRNKGDETAGNKLIADLVKKENDNLITNTEEFKNQKNVSGRWHTYFDKLLVKGVGAFNSNECVSLEPDLKHVRIHRCIYFDVAKELNATKVAQIICDADIDLHNKLFPPFVFHRNGSEENTLAYGAIACEYVWENKSTYIQPDTSDFKKNGIVINPMLLLPLADAESLGLYYQKTENGTLVIPGYTGLETGQNVETLIHFDDVHIQARGRIRDKFYRPINGHPIGVKVDLLDESRQTSEIIQKIVSGEDAHLVNRQAIRYPANINVNFGDQQAQTRDINATGAAILGGNGIKPGQKLPFLFEYGEKQIETIGKVCWERTENSLLFGIHFENDDSAVEIGTMVNQVKAMHRNLTLDLSRNLPR